HQAEVRPVREAEVFHVGGADLHIFPHRPPLNALVRRVIGQWLIPSPNSWSETRRRCGRSWNARRPRAIKISALKLFTQRAFAALELCYEDGAKEISCQDAPTPAKHPNQDQNKRLHKPKCVELIGRGTSVLPCYDEFLVGPRKSCTFAGLHL